MILLSFVDVHTMVRMSLVDDSYYYYSGGSALLSDTRQPSVMYCRKEKPDMYTPDFSFTPSFLTMGRPYTE